LSRAERPVAPQLVSEVLQNVMLFGKSFFDPGVATYEGFSPVSIDFGGNGGRTSGIPHGGSFDEPSPGRMNVRSRAHDATSYRSAVGEGTVGMVATLATRTSFASSAIDAPRMASSCRKRVKPPRIEMAAYRSSIVGYIRPSPSFRRGPSPRRLGTPRERATRSSCSDERIAPTD